MIRINQLACDGCGCCIAVCAQDALALSEKELSCTHEQCTACRRCIQACPIGALGDEGAEEKV